jgi:arylsulfatase
VSDVVHIIMAGYDDAEAARADYADLKKMNRNAGTTLDGMVLVAREADGSIKVKESGDDDDRVFGGTLVGTVGGFALGLFFPPALLASTVVGAALGALGGDLVKHHHEKGLADDLETVLPAGGSAVIVVVEPRFAGHAKSCLTHADRDAVKEADAKQADALKKALELAAKNASDA